MLKDRLVAHRGYQRKYPENTLLAMAEAVAAGAHYLETDIQLTRDLQPVLYHDEQLSRISGRKGYIHDLTLSEACALPAFEPYRLKQQYRDETVPSLDAFAEFLKSQAGVTAFIEIKEESIRHFGRQVVFDAISPSVASLGEQAVVISFDSEFIALTKARLEVQTGIVVHHWSQIEAPKTREIAPDYLFVNVKRIPYGEDLSRFDPLLVVYEIDQPARAVELFDQGADMVETFDVGGMLTSLASHSL